MDLLDKFASFWVKISGYIFVAALTYILVSCINYAEPQPMPPAPSVPGPVVDVVRQAEVVALWCEKKKCREDVLVCLSETEPSEYLNCFVGDAHGN